MDKDDRSLMKERCQYQSDLKCDLPFIKFLVSFGLRVNNIVRRTIERSDKGPREDYGDLSSKVMLVKRYVNNPR